MFERVNLLLIILDFAGELVQVFTAQVSFLPIGLTQGLRRFSGLLQRVVDLGHSHVNKPLDVGFGPLEFLPFMVRVTKVNQFSSLKEHENVDCSGCMVHGLVEKVSQLSLLRRKHL